MFPLLLANQYKEVEAGLKALRFANPINPSDVNANGCTASADALQVINELDGRLYSDGKSNPSGAILTVVAEMRSSDQRRKLFGVDGPTTTTAKHITVAGVLHSDIAESRRKKSSLHPIRHSRIPASQRGCVLADTTRARSIRRTQGPLPFLLSSRIPCGNHVKHAPRALFPSAPDVRRS